MSTSSSMITTASATANMPTAAERRGGSMELLRDFFLPEMVFLRYALLIGALSSIALGVIGTMVVTRRISSIAGASAHAALANDHRAARSCFFIFRVANAHIQRSDGDLFQHDLPPSHHGIHRTHPYRYWHLEEYGVWQQYDPNTIHAYTYGS